MYSKQGCCACFTPQDTINQINIIAKKAKQKVEMQEKDNDRAKKMPGQVCVGVAA